MSDSTINQQVEKALSAVIDAGLASKKADIAQATGYSNSYFTEILKGRMKVGSELIQKLFTAYKIDPNYLFGLSESVFYNTPKEYEFNSDITHVIKESEDGHSYNKNANILHPKSRESLHPNLHPNNNLGLPKVVSIGENEQELITLVPSKAAAGYLNGYADPEYVETLPTIRLPNIGNGTHRAFEIKGHSMNPTIHNGSISIGRWVESLDEIRDRRIYIVVTKSEGIVVKRVLNRIEESGKLILLSDNQNKREYPNIHLYADDILELWYQRANMSFEFPEPDTIYNRVNDLEARLSTFEDKIKHLLK